MKIEQLKTEYLSNKAQILLLDNQGNLIESCNTLFALEHNMDTTLPNLFPVLESLLPLLDQLPDTDEINLPRVEFETPDNSSFIADFTFYKNPSDPKQIIWIIQDLTKQYNHFSHIQQE